MIRTTVTEGSTAASVPGVPLLAPVAQGRVRGDACEVRLGAQQGGFGLETDLGDDAVDRTANRDSPASQSPEQPRGSGYELSSLISFRCLSINSRRGAWLAFFLEGVQETAEGASSSSKSRRSDSDDCAWPASLRT